MGEISRKFKYNLVSHGVTKAMTITTVVVHCTSPGVPEMCVPSWGGTVDSQDLLACWSRIT